MRHRATRALAGTLATAATSLALPSATATFTASTATVAVASTAAAASTYIVLAHDTNAIGDAAQAVRRAGGYVVNINQKIAMLTVRAASDGFASAMAGQRSVDGVAHDSPIGHIVAPSTAGTPALSREMAHGLKSFNDMERSSAAATPSAAAPSAAARSAAASATTPAPNNEPLGAEQWNMQQIRATTTGSYAFNRGDRRVTVGVLDSGIDWNHPDIAPNIDRARSRNFRAFDPAIDTGACLVACDAPLGVDPGGHGTAMASLIGAPINGFGMAGVAPNVTLVDLRVGQVSGFVLVDPVVNALTYAADSGIDVANMSFSIDPWVYNCVANPADSPAEQAEQRAIIAAVLRASLYAQAHNVTLVAPAGNENTNIDAPGTDIFSPDLPNRAAHDRTITPGTCFYLPAMAPGAVTVSGTESTTDKGDISNYGPSVDIAAPSSSRTTGTLPIVQAVSREGAINNGWLDPTNDTITGPISKECVGARCAYYVRSGGTSDSTAEVSGVAALIIGRHGTVLSPSRGLELPAPVVAARLYSTARAHACPAADPTYPNLPPFFPHSAHCAPSASGNTFYGHGIVDAATAAR